MKQPSEHKIQVALIDYLDVAARRDIFYGAVPNGGFRHIRQATKLKAEGVRRGVPDLFFMLPGGQTGWLEMKTPKGRLSPEQKQFREMAIHNGHLWAMAKSVDEAIVILSGWGVIRSAYRRTTSFFATDHLETIKLQPKELPSGTQA